MAKRLERVKQGIRETIFDRLTTKQKMAVIFVIFVCLPMLVMMAAYYRYSMDIIKTEVSQSMLKALAQTENNLSFRLSMIAESASGVMDAVYPYVSRNSQEDTLGQQIDDFGTISNIAGAYNGKNMIYRLRLFVADDKLYARQHDLIFGLSEMDYTKQLWQSFDKGRSLLWLDAYDYENRLEHRRDRIFSCVSMKRKLGSDEFAAVLFADVLETDISSLLDLGMNYDETVCLVSEEGRVLSHRQKSLLGKSILSDADLADIAARQEGILYPKEENAPYIIAFKKLDFCNWYLIANFPQDKTYGLARNSFNWMGITIMSGIFLILVLSALLFFSIIIDSTIKRINLMTGKIVARQSAPLLQRDKKKSADLTDLEKNVDRMVDTIKELLEDSYRSKIANREAQMKALQAQINPHFLYNTLDTIKWMIMDEEWENSVDMVNALSSYFRISLNRGRDIVTIRDECELSRVYLNIQQVRFDNKFTVQEDIDGDILDCLIPKLSMQPLIENALLHGLVNEEEGVIAISIRSEKDDVVIQIADNGCGIAEEKLKMLLNGPSSSGYGLFNVNERIHLMCGEGYGISLTSRLRKGTVATIRLKRIDDLSQIQTERL